MVSGGHGPRYGRGQTQRGGVSTVGGASVVSWWQGLESGARCQWVEGAVG